MSRLQNSRREHVVANYFGIAGVSGAIISLLAPFFGALPQKSVIVGLAALAALFFSAKPGARLIYSILTIIITGLNFGVVLPAAVTGQAPIFPELSSDRIVIVYLTIGIIWLVTLRWLGPLTEPALRFIFTGQAGSDGSKKKYYQPVPKKDTRQTAASNAKDVSPTNALVEQGRARLNSGDYAGAVDKFSLAIQINPTSSSYYLLGRAHLLGNANDLAVLAFSTAIDLDDKNHDALSLRSVAQYNLRNLTQALQDADRAIAIKPNEGANYFKRAIFRSELAKTSSTSPDFDRCIADCRRAIDLDFRDKAVLNLLGKCYLDRGITHMVNRLLKEAIDDWTRAIELNENEVLVDAYGLRAFAKAIFRDFVGAEHDADFVANNLKSAAKPRGIALACTIKGLTLLVRHNYKNAIEEFDSALHHLPGYELALLCRGKAKEAIGDKNSAAADLLAAARLEKWIQEQVLSIISNSHESA